VFERVRDSYEFPADLAEDAGDDSGAGALRWTASVVALTAALLALFNAQAIRGWAEELPPGPGTIRVVAAAEAWDDTTRALGLGAGHARMRKAWKHVESARWTPQPAVVEEARR
jgi:hypothetical protein